MYIPNRQVCVRWLTKLDDYTPARLPAQVQRQHFSCLFWEITEEIRFRSRGLEDQREVEKSKAKRTEIWNISLQS